MKKIAWITADCFVDCDLDMVAALNDYYDIEWNIVLPLINNRFSKNQIEKKNSLFLTKKVFWFEKYRLRNIKNIAFYWGILKKVKRQEPDIIYINMQGLPYLAFLCFILLERKKTIFAVHQAQVHEGMNFQKITKLYFRFLNSWFLNFQLFSDTQADIFKKKYRNKNTFIIPLGLKDFGDSSKHPHNDKIVFFNFGTIIKNKNIGLLVIAACNLYEKGITNFKVKIVGKCEDWNKYANLIRYPELFELNISSIKNEEIPDLFCSSHYLVLPYSAVSQSGPLKIAYNYNIPVIASDLEEFKNEIVDNITGYLFKNSDVESLEKTMIKAILNHESMYLKLKANQFKNTTSKYSMDSIVEKYYIMFNQIR